jgi:hypothetical protein
MAEREGKECEMCASNQAGSLGNKCDGRCDVLKQHRHNWAKFGCWCGAPKPFSGAWWKRICILIFRRINGRN